MNTKIRTILWCSNLAIVVLLLARQEHFQHLKTIRDEKADRRDEEAEKRSEKRAKIAALDLRISAYLKCLGADCDNLYPDAAAAVKKARDQAAAEQSSK